MQGNRQQTQAGTTANASPVTASTEILTVVETAALLKVPVSSVYEWTRYRGAQRVPLPHRKLGKYLRFLRSEIDAWLIGLPQAHNARKRVYTRKEAPPDPVAPVQPRKGRTT